MRPLSSIRFRIVAAFLAATVLMLSALIFLIVQYQGVARSQALVTEGFLPLALKIDQLHADEQRVDNDIGRLLRDAKRPTTGAASASLIYGERLRENIQEARVHARQATQMATDAEDRAVLHKTQIQLAAIDDLFHQYFQRVVAFVRLAEAGEKERAAELTEALSRDGRMLGEEIDKLSQLIDGRMQRLTRETEVKRSRATAIAFLITGLAVVVSVVLVGAVLYALEPINRLTTQVQRLAAGDYTGRVEVRGGDEVAILAREFDEMVRALQLRDRTLVERAEQLNRLSRYLGSVLDSLEDGLFVVEEGTVTLANPAASRVWGVQQEARPPRSVGSFVETPGYHEVEREGLQYEVRVTPFGENGVVVSSADVTEQRRAKERLARSERLALIGQMLAQITHEVRNPLNALSLNAEMLAEELAQLDPDRQTEAWDLLGTVTGEIERLTAVTAHYLQLARRPPARLVPEPLPGLVEDVIRLLQAELEQQGVGLDVQLRVPEPQLVDGNQLRQALLNVVRNAVEAGARHLVLELDRVGDEVRIVLTDDGPGMSEEEIAKAFDPFFSTKASGTGLGLAITRQILEDHDGAVHVHSRPGEGTSLVLALPRRPAPQTSDSQRRAP